MANSRPFFFKRWMLGLGNAYDRWLFGFTPRNGETVANTHWWAVVLGIIAGVTGAAKSIFSDSIEPSGLVLSIAGGIALIIAAVYAFKNIPMFNGVVRKLLRLFFILAVSAIGFSFGYIVGMLLGAVVIVVVILWLFIKVLFAMLANSGSSSSSSSTVKKRYNLDDGTEVEEVGNNIYEDVAGYTRYRKGTFTDEFTKIDW